MLIKKQKKRRLILSFLLAVCGCILTLFMLIHPRETYEGALYGLQLWGTVLVPSLLPFFIITEILLSLGIVAVMGELLDPLMRPVFNLPGSTSFVLAMGFTSGFPMGAILTRRLYEEDLCTKSEAERLVTFTNNSSPLFILAAIGVGMFNDPALGIILAIAHYSSNLCLGILFGSFSKRPPETPVLKKSLFNKIVLAFAKAQNNRKPLGKILSDSIKIGITNVLQISGFVIFFAVLANLLEVSGLFRYIANFFSIIIAALGFPSLLNTSFTKGLLEITLGLKDLSLHTLPLQVKAAAASIILGWSGLSIQAQVTSFLSGSSLSPRLYYLARILQAFLAGLIAYLLTLEQGLWKEYSALPVISAISGGSANLAVYNLLFTLKIISWIFLGMLLLSSVFSLFRKVKDLVKTGLLRT